MAVKTYMLPSTLTDGFSNAPLIDGVDQTAATRTDGWLVAKIAATRSQEFTPGAKSPSGGFSLESSNPKPPTPSIAACMVTPAALTGTFAATAWTLTFAVRAGTASSQAGRIRLRVFRGVDGQTAGLATEITSAVLVGTTTAALSTTADVTSVVTWSPGTVTVTNEFLFFELAWEITTASGSNNGDVLFRTGQAAGGTRIVTPDLSAGASTYTKAGYAKENG